MLLELTVSSSTQSSTQTFQSCDSSWNPRVLATVIAVAVELGCPQQRNLRQQPQSHGLSHSDVVLECWWGMEPMAEEELLRHLWCNESDFIKAWGWVSQWVKCLLGLRS